MIINATAKFFDACEEITQDGIANAVFTEYWITVVIGYCTAADVRLIVNTMLTDDQITSIIEMSDAEIDRRIGVQDPGDKLVKKLSMFITAHIIKTRQPQSQAIGEYSENAGDVLKVWKREIERIYRLYKVVSVKRSEYRHIDESKRYPEA